jgi:hypothetical protein
MRYSCDAGLLDLGKQCIVPFADLLDELIELVREDAAALECSAEIEGLRETFARGTSAHRQLKVYETALGEGASDEEAKKVFANVVDPLLALSKCPDFIVNRGHYFGTDMLKEEPGLSDTDKRALIEFLKTL